MTDSIISKLLNSEDPSIRYKTLVNVLGKKKNSTAIAKLQKRIKSSDRAVKLLSDRGPDGKLPYHPYQKWRGAHWVMVCLSDIGYPAGDKSLRPLREQVYDWLLSEKHEKSIKTIRGRVRRCASQESFALYYLLKLGLADDRTDLLAKKLIGWQWPDGGWNCDKKPQAVNSSFVESLIPLRALSLYLKTTRDKEIRRSVVNAAELFLKRKLYKRSTNGEVIKKRFIKLHYPCYYEYDILFGLKVMAETGFINDSRCNDALDLLESKRLPDGGFPAEEKLYRVAGTARSSRCSSVDWGGAGLKRSNEFVTADALYVLKQAGRLN